MPRYAVVNKNGKIENFTDADAQVASLNPSFIAVTDTTLDFGDMIDDQGVLVTKKTVNTNESRQICRELVRQAFRDSDWTQVPDSPLNGAKTALWATYRTTLKTNWQTAKVLPDPSGSMVWPTAPGDNADGL